MKDHLKDLYNYLTEKDCKNVAVYDLSAEGQDCDYIYVASMSDAGNNKKLALSIMKDFEMTKYPEGFHKGEWIIFDFVQCVLHLFVETTREKYNLDKLWKSKKMAI
ncbi:MAG: RsfS/YbeB/iojap family protein [Clostridia bacterium]|nr:RsfS/YbeB/iojap family protein [Clostridia bacterium]